MRAVETRPRSSSRRRAATPPPARPGGPRRPGSRARRLRPLVPTRCSPRPCWCWRRSSGSRCTGWSRCPSSSTGSRNCSPAWGTFIGLRNYQDILGDPFFWTVVVRTVLFAAVCVGLTMVLGTLVAPPLRNLGRPMRVAVTAGLVAAWAMPTLTAISIWQWLFDFEFGGGQLAADPARGRRLRAAQLVRPAAPGVRGDRGGGRLAVVPVRGAVAVLAGVSEIPADAAGGGPGGRGQALAGVAPRAPAHCSSRSS